MPPHASLGASFPPPAPPFALTEEKAYLKDLPGKYKELASEHNQVLELARARMGKFMAPVPEPSSSS